MKSNTLTERYLHEVTRRIPADQRADVADELRTTIADTVEAREPADPAVAEREVIAEMGDPIRLAVRYSDRPLGLIGPELFPSYLRLLIVLLTTVLPVVVIATVALDLLDNKDVGSAIGSGIGAVLIVGAQMIAWPTAIFALVERSSHRADFVAATDTWTPDALPEVREAERGSTAACASVVWNALLIGLIVWQHNARPYRGDGEPMEVLDPALWSGWIWPILAGLAGIIALEVARIAVRGWTVPLAIGYAIAEAVCTLPLAWILYDRRFFNPELLAEVGFTVHDSFYTLAVLGVLTIGAFESVKRFREALR